VDRYSILGVDVSLKTDSVPVREFFAHAYRWFPYLGGGETLDLGAFFESAGRASASAGKAFLDLSRSRSPENRAFLFLLESIMDRIGKSLVLHGGAVAHGDEGIIVAGPAFAGKSTLVLELVKRGHTFLSDDAAPIDRATGRLLPFPRAVGIRKGPSSPALPEGGVHELTHKWLVDPVALGARLPAESCRPTRLFYLGRSGTEGGSGRDFREFEIAFAEESREALAALEALGPASLREIPGSPFPTYTARLGAGKGPYSGLARFRREHRDAVLYVEESRSPVRRLPGKPSIRRVAASTILLHLVRDLLNRGEDGALMASHSGKLTSLMSELASLIRETKCYEVSAGSPPLTAEAIDDMLRENERSR